MVGTWLFVLIGMTGRSQSFAVYASRRTLSSLRTHALSTLSTLHFALSATLSSSHARALSTLSSSRCSCSLAYFSRALSAAVFCSKSVSSRKSFSFAVAVGFAWLLLY